ncbi:TonB-dependent receptor [Mucilaginibacter sabulilitoris]|uniref:TonB-dependent receptor n=1 Tax=Mucilaginibacter sabulilitoris TaxID=1173583 RepID=A0ABZ0TN88_9SPHI|nr:TonB-dependent receptor [Mucilaginibacter sabulilitoris]WPU93184.1 TonB-dependent receptor [Mucilaginibacter sabulilitoris]
MKHHLLILILFLLLPSALSAQSLITGRVIDEGGLTLPGATVKIANLNKGTVTDETGSYKLLSVPAGTYNVVVTYIGYQILSQSVTIAHKPVTVDFKLKLASNGNLSEVVVSGQMSSTLKALNQQKNSDRIVNVISADQIGRFPDANIGDALKRIPGIYVQLDEGEASLVSIRGTDPSKSTININGTSIPGTGDDRSVSISAIPADMVQTVEVSKSITPDMDGDAIGGVVNLITRKAPYTRLLSFTLGSGYSEIVNKPTYNGNFVFGARYLKGKKLGVMASASYYRQFLGSSSHESEWEDTKWVNQQTYFMPKYLNMVQNKLERIRQSYTVGLDLKINPKNTLVFTGIYNNYQDWRQISTLKVDDIGAKYPKNWQRASGWEGVKTKITDKNNDYVDDVKGQSYLNTTNDPLHPVFQPELERHIEGGLNDRDAAYVEQKIVNFGLEGEHILGKVKINWKGSYLRNVQNTPNRRELELESENEKSVQMDYTAPRFIKANNGFEINNILGNLKGRTSAHADSVDTWYMDNFTGTDARATTKQYLAQLDLTVPIATGKFANSLKFGAKYRDMDKLSETLAKVTWLPSIDPALKAEYDAKVAAGQTVNLRDYIGWNPFWTGFGNNLYNMSDALHVRNAEYNVGSAASSAWVSHQNASYFGNTGDYIVNEVKQDALANNYNGNEGVAAAYLMSTQNFGDKLSLIAGGRLERSSVHYGGYNYNEDLNSVPTPVEIDRSFVNFMPAVLLKYTPTKDKVFRFAYTSTISRPNYKDISPYRSVNIEDQEVSEGNADIKPTTSTNLDLMGEFYTGNAGLISAGVYYKNIRKYRIDLRDEVRFNDIKGSVQSPQSLLDEGADPASIADYQDNYNKLADENGVLERTRPGNGGVANLLGVELAFQRNLTFLPKPLSNFSIYSNYTHNFIFVKAGEPKLPGTAKDILNLSLAYEVKRFNARVSYNHTSAFVTVLGDIFQNDVYYDQVNYLDANINFFLTPKIVIYASGNNLLNQAQRKYQYQAQYTYSALYTGATATLGVKFNVY